MNHPEHHTPVLAIRSKPTGPMLWHRPRGSIVRHPSGDRSCRHVRARSSHMRRSHLQAPLSCTCSAQTPSLPTLAEAVPPWRSSSEEPPKCGKSSGVGGLLPPARGCRAAPPLLRREATGAGHPLYPVAMRVLRAHSLASLRACESAQIRYTARAGVPRSLTSAARPHQPGGVVYARPCSVGSG